MLNGFLKTQKIMQNICSKCHTHVTAEKIMIFTQMSMVYVLVKNVNANRLKKLNPMKTLLLTLLFTIYSMFAFADTTQNNTSGSNTSISGGYTSSATNTYQSGSSNNTTTTNNSTSNMRSHHQQQLHPM